LNDKQVLKYKNFLWVNTIIFILYTIFILVLIYTVSDIIPNISKELGNSGQYLNDIKNNINWILMNIDNEYSIKQKYNIDLLYEFRNLFSWDIDIASRVETIISKLKLAWYALFQIILALILSLIFVLDRIKMSKYLEWIKNSNFSFFYREYKVIFEKITRSFWLIFKAQSMIAFVNAILTSIWLFIIGLFFDWGFPLIHTLAVIVFIAWFIPVFWTFISSIPILLIAFTIVWWLKAALSVVVLILIVHAIEAYYLNPKIVSSFMELPMSLTFIVLIISEHYLWMIWLIIWISLFYLFIDLLKDTNNLINKTKEVLKTQDKIILKTKMDLKWGMRMSRKITK